METTKTQTTVPFQFDDSEVSKWALPDGATARLGRGSVRDMAFSPDGQYFAVGSTMGLWLYKSTTSTPNALWETDRGFIDGVTFAPDNRRIAAYTYLQALRVWDIHNEVCIAEMELTEEQVRSGITKPIFSQDGKHLVAFNAHTRKIFIWCSSSGKQISEIEIELSVTETESINTIYPIYFSPDLSLLAGTCYDNKNLTAEFIGVWQVETGKQVTRFDWTERWGRHCFSQCGGFFAAGGSEGKINVWNVESGNLEYAYTGYDDAQMVPYFLLDGGLIAATVYLSLPKIEIWDLEKNEKLDTLQKRTNRSFVRFFESGTQLAYSDDGEINFWTSTSKYSRTYRDSQFISLCK